MLGLGGLALPDLLRLRAQGAVDGAGEGRSVILFWLSGGPGHMETWDPKPSAPSGFRGPFGAIRTTIPGVQVGELLPEQARRMDRLAILRGVQSRHRRPHQGQSLDAHRLRGSGLQRCRQHSPAPAVDRLGGSQAASRQATRRLPRYVAVPNLRGGTDNLFHYATYLGGAANPFIVESDPNDPKYRVRNLTLPGGMTLDRLDDRRRMLEAMDSLRREADPELRDLDAYRGRAFEMLTGKEVAAAFDIIAKTPSSATATAGTPSAKARCSPAGWSKRERRS